ncbi:MAG TPA: ATP-binding protein, partial [Verrucomicrobiae bacterium]|nr:ATP-binding protein [Verrucomicrobiae bacterium]
ARELTRAMDEIVWAVSPQHDTLDSLVTYLGKFAQDFLSVAGIRCRLNVPIELPAWQLTAEVRHNLFLAFKEVLNNVLKHASATEVRITLTPSPTGFWLVVDDNGKGFDVTRNGAVDSQAATDHGLRFATGNGLTNVKKRLEEISGRFELKSAQGEGTTVRFWIAVRTDVRHQN